MKNCVYLLKIKVNVVYYDNKNNFRDYGMRNGTLYEESGMFL